MVDSQCHVSPIWFEPVETLLDQMARNAVDKAVLLQMLGQTDNAYQQLCLRRFPGRFASVVMVDCEDPDAVSQLHELAEQGATGLRLRPAARSPGADPWALWRAAAELDLAVSCVGNSAAFCNPGFERVVGTLPHLRIVLEHLGGTSQADDTEAARAARLRVMDLGRFANVHMKIPGLGELQPRLPPFAGARSLFSTERPEFLDRALEAFGPARLMWGSDFPVVSSREGYGNSLRLCREVLRDLRPSELDDIFGGVAQRVFNLAPPVRP